MHITLQGHPLCIVHWLGDEGGRLSQAPVGNEKLQSEQTRESVPRVTISGAHFYSLDPKETLLYPSTASLPVTKARESAVGRRHLGSSRHLSKVSTCREWLPLIAPRQGVPAIQGFSARG